jgi:2-dehydro-3-deoxy-D-pentonate aldolase
MIESSITPAFEGIMVPMVTPLLSNGELDKKGVERVVKHLVNGGVQGIFILGTTGEAASLKPAIKKDLIEISCKEAYTKTPVFVGITHTSLEVSLKLARSAKENGAVAVVAALPYYFALDQDDIFQYYVKLADHSPLPLFLVQLPGDDQVHYCSRNGAEAGKTCQYHWIEGQLGQWRLLPKIDPHQRRIS